MSTIARFRVQRTWLPYAYALLGCLILNWFLLYNGWPVFYEDTSSYLTRPGRVLGGLGLQSDWNPLDPSPSTVGATVSAKEEQIFQSSEDNPVWLGGRSVYYGTLMVLLAALATSHAIAVVQAYLTALAIALPWFRLGGSPILYVATLALLSAFTGISVITAAMIPDIFFAVAALAGATLLVLWRELGNVDRWVLILMLCFASLSHNSILALLLGASVLCALALLFRRWRSDYLRFTPIWLASGIGIAGLVAFSLAAQIASDRPPLNLPHLAARAATSTEGRMVLQEQCPAIKLVVCNYRRQIERGDWIAFMFARDEELAVFATAPVETKYALSDEQLSVVLLVAREQPLKFAQRQVQDLLRQLARFSLIDFDVSKKLNLPSMVADDMLSRIQQTQSYRDGGQVLSGLSFLSYVSTLLGLAAIFVYFTFMRPVQKLSEAEILALLLLVAVVINALTCAVLAGVYDRFQARVIWLIPLAACLLVARGRVQREAGTSVPL